MKENNIIGEEVNTISVQQKNIKNETYINCLKENDYNNIKTKEVFTSSRITNSVLKRMIGNSIPSKNKMDIKQLSYLKITYWGFDEKTHVGEMIVNKDVDSEIWIK